MEVQDYPEKLIDYLYGELPPAQARDFEDFLKNNPECAAEVKSLCRVRELYRERLPKLPVSSRLRNETLAEIGVRRPWYEIFRLDSIWKPSLVGACVLALTLGVSYVYQKRVAEQELIAKNQPAPVVSQPYGDLSRRDYLAAAQSSRPLLPRPSWRSQPSIGTGLVSFASYGPQAMQPYGEVRSMDIRDIDQEAELAIAQFTHQQAMRMRAMGDCDAAATELARLIKQYPSYPHAFAAAAQRIDCLFRIGQKDVATRELSWLDKHSPFLAQLIKQRWGL